MTACEVKLSRETKARTDTMPILRKMKGIMFDILVAVTFIFIVPAAIFFFLLLTVIINHQQYRLHQTLVELDHESPNKPISRKSLKRMPRHTLTTEDFKDAPSWLFACPVCLEHFGVDHKIRQVTCHNAASVFPCFS
jgi:hypothetical protein